MEPEKISGSIKRNWLAGVSTCNLHESIDGGHFLSWSAGASSAERTDLHTLLAGPSCSLFRRADTTRDIHLCTRKSTALPSPCTRWVVPCSRSFLPYPKFVVSWLLSNTLSCTNLYQRTYSRKNFHLGSYGGLRPPVEMLFRLPLRLLSLQSQLDRKNVVVNKSSTLPYNKIDG